MTEKLAYTETFDCVQCGYCLPACPTYKTMETETHSPRGRINLVKLAAEGKISLDQLQEPIDLCLGCRACERVCPTNVQYGRIFESAKVVLEEKREKEAPKRENLFRNFFFDQLFPDKKKLQAVSGFLRFYQTSGLQRVARKTGVMKLFPERLRAFEEVMPTITKSEKRKNERIVLKPDRAPIYRVAFFRGCVMDAMFERINILGMKLLQAAGCEVVVIPDETCCGALHAHSGNRKRAKELAKENIQAFEAENADWIVNSAGGCGAMLIEYEHLFTDEPEWQKRAKQFSEKNCDISVILCKLDLPFKHAVKKMVTYQPSCHMTNVQHVTEEPFQLLRSIPGLPMQPLVDADMCCGSAGIYNLVNYDESIDILTEKMADVMSVNPEVIVTTNPGCLLQMKLGVKREGASDRIEIVHLVELLAEACGLSEN